MLINDGTCVSHKRSSNRLLRTKNESMDFPQLELEPASASRAPSLFKKESRMPVRLKTCCCGDDEPITPNAKVGSDDLSQLVADEIFELPLHN